MGIPGIITTVFWFLVQNWGLLVTAITGIAAWVALLHRGLGTAGTAIVAFLASMAVLWFFVGVTRLWDRFNAYNYALGYENVFGLYDPNSPNIALQVGVNFRNVGPGGITYEVKDLRVVVGSTTIASPTYQNKGGLIPRGLARAYRFPPFDQKSIQQYAGQPIVGTIEFTALYGPAGAAPRRKLHMVIAVTYRFDSSPFGVADTITLEEDEII